MVGTFDYLRFRAFAHATEDVERVKQALAHAALSPKVTYAESLVEGTHGNPIHVFEGDLKANPGIKAFFAAVATDDPQGYARLLEEVPRRLDERLNFFLRLDKQEAYAGRHVLTHGDDAIMVRARIHSFAAKRSEPVQEVLGFLREIPSDNDA